MARPPPSSPPHPPPPTAVTPPPRSPELHHHHCHPDTGSAPCTPRPASIRTAAELDYARSAKRRRLDAEPPAPAAPPSQPLPRATVENMYNFSTPGAKANGGAVDLTKSPPGRRRLTTTAKVDTSGYTGAKKLNVKNFRTTKSNPEQYCEKTTQQIDSALTAIFAGHSPAVSNEELYRGAENLCKMGRGPQLATLLFERCEKHVVAQLRQPLLDQLSTMSSLELLSAVVAAWKQWETQMIVIRKIFFFLDRAHLLQQRLPSIQETTVSQFRQHIFEDASLKPKILEGAITLLSNDRTSSPSIDGLFTKTIEMLHELQVYTSQFEPLMLGESQDFLFNWSNTKITELDLVQYLEQAYALIESELRRCSLYSLDHSTKRELLNLLETHLVERREAELTNQDAVADLLDANDAETLQKLYELLQRRRIGSKLGPAFSKWIEDTGTAIIFDEKEQDSMVVRLLELKRKTDHIVSYSFQKNDSLALRLREAFATFINRVKKSSANWGTDNSKPGEMIAKYVDMLLRAGAKAIPDAAKTATRPHEDDEDEDMDKDAQLHDQLDQVLDLFRFLQGKAVFEAFYKKDLARRLLLGRSADADAERGMLTRLKNECGAGFTSNLEQMFKDIELARDEVSFFKQRMEGSDVQLPVDLDVKVLSAAAWPTYPDVPFVVPPEVKRTLEKFEAVYQMKHTGRKLHWKHSLAHCIVRASFPKGKKEIVVSSFQAVILLMFNNVPAGGRLRYEQIMSDSGLPEVDAKRTLQSLACAKLRPLTKYPKGKDVNNTDEFSVNEDFTHERFRFKINQLQAKETKEENKATHEQVAADRRYETQAAIVRIMKSRRTITHQELIVETINATRNRGTLQPGEIKKQIDSLIEKEYMERGDGNQYHYIA